MTGRNESPALTNCANDFSRLASPDGMLSLEFCASGGGCITSFQAATENGPVDIFRPLDKRLPYKPGFTASFPMTPFTNRISNGRLNFRGRSFDVRPLHEQEKNALHGDGWRLPWRVAERSQSRAVLELETERTPESPYVYSARQVFELENNRLNIFMAVTNRSGESLPFGIGHHPFFPRTAQTVVRARLPKVWINDAEMFAVRVIDTPAKWNFETGLRLDDDLLGPPEHGFRKEALIDNCFPEWDRRLEIDWPESGLRLIMTADPVLSKMVIFVPDRKPFFAAEAVSNTMDAFNLMDRGIPDTGTVVLEDGQTLEGTTTFEIADIPRERRTND